MFGPDEEKDIDNIGNFEDIPDYVIDYLIDESSKDNTIPPPDPERIKKLLELVEKNKDKD